MLEFVDQKSGCVIDEVPFEVESAERISALLMIEPTEFDPRVQYELDCDDIARVKSALNIRTEAEHSCCVYLRARRPTDDLPYKIHTNRELTLMLAGSKPLAAFVEDYPRVTVQEVIPEAAFEPYVLSGRFVKREKLYPGLEDGGPQRDGPRRSIRRVLYARKDEAWRIDAYLLLHEVAVYSGWSEGFERMEGTLLGYEQWQNDAYIRMMRARHKA